MLHRMGVERCCCVSTPVSGSISQSGANGFIYGATPASGGSNDPFAIFSSSIHRYTLDIHGGAISFAGGILATPGVTFTDARMRFTVTNTRPDGFGGVETSTASPDQDLIVFAFPYATTVAGSWVTGPTWGVASGDDWGTGGTRTTPDVSAEINAVVAHPSYNPVVGVGIGLYPLTQSPSTITVFRTMAFAGTLLYTATT